MAADAHNLYMSMTSAAVEAGPKLGPDQSWPVIVLVAHGDTITPLVPPPIKHKHDLAAIFGGWIPTMIRGLDGAPAHAASVQWPGLVDAPLGPSLNGHGRKTGVHVIAVERTVAWESWAIINRRAIARMHPILGEFHAPIRIDDPATAPSADHFAHRSLLFALELL